MKFVTLTTMNDDGAAAMARDAIADLDIPVRLRRRGPDHAYAGLFVKEQIEVQVPEDQQEAAREALAWLERDAELHALAAGAGAAAGDDMAAPGEDDRDEGPAPRPVRLSTALVLAVLVPLPVACLYAGARRLGHGLIGLAAGLFVLALASGQPGVAVQSLMVIKGVDLVLALPRLLAARAPAPSDRSGSEAPPT